MKFYRSDRVSSLIEKELGMLLIKEIETPGALITITAVEVQRKMERAVVKFSVIPSEKAPEVLKILGKAAGRLQFMLSRKLNIKPMPKIVFEIDRGPENAAQVEKALLSDNNSVY
ncbi:MAG TPA: ribosome-binding factor A [Candidatus Paceibacterota bacterium]